MIKGFGYWFGELARPYTFWSLATASAVSILMMAWGIYQGLVSGKVDGYQAAVFIGVVLGGASAIYVSKTYENKWSNNASAEVEKVRAQASPPPDEALKPAGPPAERSLEDPA